MHQVKTTLYALNKDESFQQWKVFTVGSTIVVEFGKLGGKIQVKRTEAKPKNVGRANETTAEEQAVLEAISKWEKQVRTGYRESTEELETVEQFSPMLAHDGNKRSHDIVYPCYVQPKLDGLRCLVTFDVSGNPIFNSRGNKTYPIQGTIAEQLSELRHKTLNTIFENRTPMFDGEVYLHGLSLQKIVALAKKWRTHAQIEVEIDKDFEADKKRRSKAIASGEPTWKNFAKREISVDVEPIRDTDRYNGYESADLQFHIFDIPDAKKQWYIKKPEDQIKWADCRLTDLMLTALEGSGMSHLVFVRGKVLSTEAEVKEQIGIYMQSNYEGVIVRNFKGVYEFNQRSSDLIKWKIFQTTEAFVFGFEIDKNEEVLLHCRLQSGVEFKVKMKGTHQYRMNCMYLVGKFITISFQAYTDDGAPSFASGITERDVNPTTWEVLE